MKRQLLPMGLRFTLAGSRSGDRITRRGWLVPSLRGSLLVVVASLVLLDGPRLDSLLWLAALAVTAAAAQLRNRNDVPTRLLIAGEAVIAALGGVLTGGATRPLLAYLPAATVAAGIAAGLNAAVITSVLIAAVLTAGHLRFTGAEASRYTADAVQIAFMSFVTGVLASLLRGVLSTTRSADDQRFAEAYRLLEQLRGVTRRLPGSLDPGSVAANLITECRAVATFSKAGVFLQTGGSVLVPLALEGVRRVPWRVDLDEPGPVATAWQTGMPAVQHRQADDVGRRQGSHLMVFPITVDLRAVGVVILEWVGATPLELGVVEMVGPIVQASGLPLETAILFDDLRSSAALEERERLAKDMHDGIAQDLAYVGFELDGLLAELRHGETERSEQHALELRQRITGLITDLRLSMSDLRSSIGPTRGLGAALSEYIRSVGTSSAITVHLSLAEGAIRLAANTELELLRIAHEAIAAARRRPGVANLWVTLTVDPPMASLLVEDDSDEDTALPRPLDASVMYERAKRIHAHVALTRRLPRGERVSVEVGGGSDVDGVAG